jgi:hypothetical protein
MKRLDNSMETRSDVRILPMHAATVTHRRWLRPVKFALEGTVTSKVGIPGLSHMPICRSHVCTCNRFENTLISYDPNRL